LSVYPALLVAVATDSKSSAGDHPCLIHELSIKIQIITKVLISEAD
jgi:hypothetical protein